MSAPETNVRKQKRRHGPVLVMILAAGALALLAALGAGIWVEEDIEDEAAPARATGPAADAEGG